MSVSEIENYRDLILENIEYDYLCREFATYREDLDEIVELMVETVCARRKTTRIAGSDFPHEVVRSRFLKLDSEHIRFVMDSLQKNTTEVRNMKQYLLTVLFNASTTISNYYTSQVNHDMNAGGWYPMQEEVENRTLTLVVNGTKFTGRLFKAAICKYLAHCKEKKLQKQRSRDAPVKPQGKQTVKQLIGQNQGVSNIEITDPSIKEFEKIARKYGVDYAVKKDRSTSPPKYLIFFKARDADALTAAFTEYTGKKVKKAEKTERPSVLAKLNQFKELVKNAVVDRTRRKELER